ncbi:fatty acid desaturase family protein [Massilia glaciei]|nr:fatty acid desaturase [Massilia glaciei]
MNLANRPHDDPDHALAPSDARGLLHFALALALSAGGALLATLDNGWAWSAGQLLLALGLTLWFVLLHECGHRNLFRSRWLNRAAGVVAAFMALIPWTAWRQVHAYHHVWTGWQDRDLTTMALVPRPVARYERWIINGAWRTGLPLFSLLYRVQNFWNTPRLSRHFTPALMRRIRVENLAFLLAYAALLAWFGPGDALGLVGGGLLLSLAFQDLLLVSQHTHMPTRRAGGERVAPFSNMEQQANTRSLRLPRWLSWLLLHVDAHELHHMHVRVPGYRLRALKQDAPNEVHWWTWLRAAKSLSGVDFMFGARERTGMLL